MYSLRLEYVTIFAKKVRTLRLTPFFLILPLDMEMKSYEYPKEEQHKGFLDRIHIPYKRKELSELTQPFITFPEI